VIGVAAAGLTVVLAAGVLVLVVAALWWLDRYDREPVRWLAFAFAWGALASPLLAVVSEGAATGILHAVHGRYLGGVLAVVTFGPFLEELAKAAGIVIVVAVSSSFDNPTDGVVYGTAVGLGFAMTENFVYELSAAGSGQFERFLAVAVVRTLLTAGIHGLCSGIVGGSLGFAYLSRNRVSRLLWFLGGLSTAVILHGSWNGLLTSAAITGNGRGVAVAAGLVFGLYLAYGLVLAAFLHGEHLILKRQLAEEVELGVLPSWVAQIIPYYRKRVRGRWWPERQERTVLTLLITRLAFRKHAMRRLPPDEAAVAGLEVVQLRQKIRTMLGVAVGSSVKDS